MNDDLTRIWAEYDKKLDANLRLNEQLIKKINLKQSRSETGLMVKYEVFSLAITFPTMLYVFIASLRLAGKPEFLLTGLASVIIGITYMILSAIRLYRCLQINHYAMPVVALQEALARIRITVLRFRKTELLLIPVFVPLIIPVLFMAVHHINLYENLLFFGAVLFVCIGVGFPLTLLINNKIYDTRIRNAEILLNQIREFDEGN